MTTFTFIPWYVRVCRGVKSNILGAVYVFVSLLVALAPFLLFVGFWLTLAYVAYHFITKFW